MAAADGRLALRASVYEAQEDRRQVSALLDRVVRTLLVAPTPTGDAGLDLLRRLGSLTVPVVLVARLPTPALDAAITAHSLGAGLAIRHSVTLGHRRIALDAGWWETSVSISLAAPDGLRFEVPLYGSAGWAGAYDEEVAATSDPPLFTALSCGRPWRSARPAVARNGSLPRPTGDNAAGLRLRARPGSAAA